MNSLRLLTGQRGAAATEFALSVLVLVPLLVATGLAGELLSASAKAQEAEVSAAWEASGHRLHDYQQGGGAELARAGDRAATRIESHLADLDSFMNQGGDGRSLPFLKLAPVEVRCEKAAPSHPDYLPFAELPATQQGPGRAQYFVNDRPATALLHRDSSYLVCRARVRAHLELAGFDASLADTTHEPGLASQADAALSFCGIGPTLHACTQGGKGSGLMLLADDWGVEDGHTLHLEHPKQDNPAYFRVGEAIFAGNFASHGIRSSYNYLMGSQEDHADSSSFKVGNLDKVSDVRMVPNDVGPRTPTHLSPYEVQGGVPRQLHNQRRNHRYLGMPSAGYNQP